MKQTLLLEHFIARKPSFTAPSTSRKRRNRSDSDSSSSPEPSKQPSLAQERSEVPAARGEKASNELSGKDISAVLGRVKKVPGVSAQTSEILSRLNRRYGERNSTTLRDVLDGVSAKDKYADLLSGQRELILPYKYKKLISLLEIIDLELTSDNTAPVTFDIIQTLAEEKMQSEVSLMDLQRILKVYPEAYEVSWIYLESYLCHQICVALPFYRTQNARSTNNSLTLRKETLKSNLIEITKQHHQAFINTLPVKPKINYARLKVWYHEFDVHNVPDIELAPLPECPLQESQQSSAQETESQSPPIYNQETSSIHNQQISQETIPQKSLSEDNTQTNIIQDPVVINPPALSPSIKVQRMILLTESLDSMYSAHTKPSQFLHLVLRKLLKFSETAVEEVEKELRELVRMFPGWLRLIKTSTGEVLRMNRETNYLVPVIKEEIRKRFY